MLIIRLRVSVHRFWYKMWWYWYMEVKLIRMEKNVVSLHQPFLLPIIAIEKPLCFPLGWKCCIDPLVGEAKLLTRLEEKCTCNYWNCQYGHISEKNFGILVNRSCVFLSTILLQNESVRSLIHPAIVLNCLPRKS